MLNLLALFAGASIGVQATAASRQAQAGRTSLDADAATSDQNAALARQQARYAIDAGRAAEQDVTAKGRALMGDQRATMAANGLDLTEGSPLDILVGTEAAMQRDAARVRDNAARDAWAAEVQATNYENRGKAAGAGAAQFSPSQAFTTSLLTNGLQYASRWYAMRQG